MACFNVRSLSASIVCLAVLAGCGGGTDLPDIGDVSGKVTLDGKPLDGARIEFVPAKGRPSYGLSDDEGNYTLRYSASVNGAMLGKHKVAIRSEREPVLGEGDTPSVEARKELLPAKYHEQSELTADVVAGSNTIDFPLTSK